MYEITPPLDADTHVIGYNVVPRFTGYEVTFGIPALSGVPIIGPTIAEAIKFRAGKNDVVVVPILQEDMYKLRRPNENPSGTVRKLAPVGAPRLQEPSTLRNQRGAAGPTD